MDVSNCVIMFKAAIPAPVSVASILPITDFRVQVSSIISLQFSLTSIP